MGMKLMAEAGSTLAFVTIDTGTIIFTLINTLLIFLIYRFFLHNKVCAILDQRRDAVNKEMDDARTAKEDAEKTKQEYTQKLAVSKEEAAKIVADATKKAQERESQIIAEANKNASIIKDKAEEQIEREKKKAVNEIKDEISEIVILAAEKVAEKEISAKDNENLINSFLVNIGEDK